MQSSQCLCIGPKNSKLEHVDGPQQEVGCSSLRGDVLPVSHARVIVVFKTGVFWIKALLKCLMKCQKVQEEPKQVEWKEDGEMRNQAGNKDTVMLTCK